MTLKAWKHRYLTSDLKHLYILITCVDFTIYSVQNDI